MYYSSTSFQDVSIFFIFVLKAGGILWPVISSISSLEQEAHKVSL